MSINVSKLKELIKRKDWLGCAILIERLHDLTAEVCGIIEANHLVYCEECILRAAIASHGYRLSLFVNDHEACVRREVAHRGYGINRLLCDPNPFVRKEAEDKLHQLVA